MNIADTLRLSESDRDTFVRDYWQQRPLLLRGALPGFVSPISAEELAGLALEPDVESRLISGSGTGEWRLRHGPFVAQDFTTAPEHDWTLLVQDVEKHLPDLAFIVDAFDLVPAWRLDDLMVSYAVPGGSVGPHRDAYDVFLLQGTGLRRWQIDDRAEADHRNVDRGGVRQLQAFQANREWILEPGDVLYLPPGVPHHGVALTPCMTYSVGMRAPALTDIITEALEEIDTMDGATSPLLRDHRRTPAQHPLEVDEDSRRNARSQIRRLLRADRVLDRALARAVSRPKAGLPWPPDPPTSSDGLPLDDDAQLCRNPAVRASLLAPSSRDCGWLYVNGESIPLTTRAYRLARLLTSRRHVAVSELVVETSHTDQQQLLEHLLRLGYWYRHERDD